MKISMGIFVIPSFVITGNYKKPKYLSTDECVSKTYHRNASIQLNTISNPKKQAIKTHNMDESPDTCTRKKSQTRKQYILYDNISVTLENLKQSTVIEQWLWEASSRG